VPYYKQERCDDKSIAYIHGDELVSKKVSSYFYKKGLIMILQWSVLFLIIAIVAAVFGFGGISSEAAWIAKVLFLLFVILFVLSLLGVVNLPPFTL
jgi:uncharacterized membrane protein YtjA (UPF0391 family)